ncbi:MAG: hypothetical protein ABIQ27_10030 [Flavobacterium sp.]|uniref:hypothetical protein n=1 Tax=Flavobacterium sp. TaxID=239 RepID=UPI003262D600
MVPKNKKLVFRGLLNEFFIDVPNSKSFEASGNGITKKDNNIYNLNPGAGLETTITIDIVLRNNKKVSEKHVFNFKNTGSIISTFNKMEGGIIKLQKSALKDGVVDVRVSDKNIEDFIEVTQFSFKIPGMPAMVIEGNKIDNKTFEKINKNASKGDEITIFDIRTKSIKIKSGPICGIQPMIIQIL